MFDGELLTTNDGIHQTVGRCQTVGRGEESDPARSDGNIVISQPLQAGLIITKWGGELQGIGDIIESGSEIRKVPIQKANWFQSLPDHIPRAKIAMADDLTWLPIELSVGPASARWRLVVRYSVVIGTKEAGEGCQPRLIDHFVPRLLPGLTWDVPQDLPALVIAADDPWRIGKLMLAEELEKVMYCRCPPTSVPMNGVTQYLDAHRCSPFPTTSSASPILPGARTRSVTADQDQVQGRGQPWERSIGDPVNY